MTEQEKQEIIDELEKKIEDKYKGYLTHVDVASTLKNPRDKWFRNEYEKTGKSIMAYIFESGITSYQVWETIRKLTCVICGKQYVRHLCDTPYAEEVAEKLCQFVYDLKMEYKGQDLEG